MTRTRSEIAQEAELFAETMVDALLTTLASQSEPARARLPRIGFDPDDQVRLPEGRDRPRGRKGIPGQTYH